MRSKADETAGATALPLPDARLCRILGNPLRHEIVMRTAARPWSPTELAKVTGKTLTHVSKALEELKREDLVELVGTKPGPKGGKMHLYKASRFVVSAEEFEQLPKSKQAASSAKVVAELHEDMASAVETGAFYSHPHHALIRDHRAVDDQGMERCAEILERAHAEIVEVEEESLDRHGGATDGLVGIGVGLVAFPRAAVGRAR